MLRGTVLIAILSLRGLFVRSFHGPVRCGNGLFSEVFPLRDHITHLQTACTELLKVGNVSAAPQMLSTRYDGHLPSCDSYAWLTSYNHKNWIDVTFKD